MKRLYTFVQITVLSLLFTGSAYAASDGVATLSDLENMAKRLISTMGALAGIGLFVALVIGGFTFLFSAGDAKKLEKARNSITYAVIGIVVIAGAYLIIQLLADFTGVQNILQFNLNF